MSNLSCWCLGKVHLFEKSVGGTNTQHGSGCMLMDSLTSVSIQKSPNENSFWHLSPLVELRAEHPSHWPYRLTIWSTNFWHSAPFIGHLLKMCALPSCRTILSKWQHRQTQETDCQKLEPVEDGHTAPTYSMQLLSLHDIMPGDSSFVTFWCLVRWLCVTANLRRGQAFVLRDLIEHKSSWHGLEPLLPRRYVPNTTPIQK